MVTVFLEHGSKIHTYAQTTSPSLNTSLILNLFLSATCWITWASVILTTDRLFASVQSSESSSSAPASLMSHFEIEM